MAITYKKTLDNVITFVNSNSLFNKKALIVTGQHGDEHTPLKVGMDLIRILSEDSVINWDLYSHIVLINGANKQALAAGERFVETDKQDLFDYNRSYKTNTDQTNPQYIKQLAEQSDLVIDIHSSPYVVTPFVALDSDHQFTEDLLQFCNNENIPYLIVPQSNENTLKRWVLNSNLIGDNERVGFLSNNHSLKIAFTVETVGINQIVDDNNCCLQLVENILNNSCNISVKNNKPTNRQTNIITSDIEGLFFRTNYANYIKKDEVVGSVYNLLGEKIVDVTSDVDGQVIQCICSQYISQGQWIIAVNPIQ